MMVVIQANKDNEYCYWLLVTGYWLLVTGYWLLVTGYWFIQSGISTVKIKKTSVRFFIDSISAASYGADHEDIGLH